MDNRTEPGYWLSPFMPNDEFQMRYLHSDDYRDLKSSGTKITQGFTVPRVSLRKMLKQ